MSFGNGMGTRDIINTGVDPNFSVEQCICIVIDYKKAFDNVKHVKLIYLLRQVGLYGKYSRYWNQSAYGNMLTLDIQILKIIRSILSSLVYKHNLLGTLNMNFKNYVLQRIKTNIGK